MLDRLAPTASRGGLSMDYEKLAVAIKLCGSTPKVDQCPQCPYWASGDMNNCIPRVTADAATAITDLLARAEAAEARAEKAERERDEYFKHLQGLCFCCGHRTDGFDCNVKCYGHKRGTAWVYAGPMKEE